MLETGLLSDMLASITQAIVKIANNTATLANITGTLVVLSLVAIVNYDIFARGLFNLPFRGAVEVVQFTLVLVVFLQLPDVIKTGRLTRSDGLLGMIKRNHPKTAAVISFFINLLSATVMTLIAVTMYPEFIDMWETQDFFGIPGVFTAPWWPIKLTIFCSTALCALLFVIKVISKNDKDNNK